MGGEKRADETANRISRKGQIELKIEKSNLKKEKRKKKKKSKEKEKEKRKKKAATSTPYRRKSKRIVEM